MLGPLAIADGGAEEGLGEQRNQEDARDGRDVYSRRHGEGNLYISSFGGRQGLCVKSVRRVVIVVVVVAARHEREACKLGVPCPFFRPFR